jgi:hypothetical protein
MELAVIACVCDDSARSAAASPSSPSRSINHSIPFLPPLAVDAFVACGGNADKSGHVERQTLVKIIKTDFGLQINIEELIDAIDADGSGEIEYGEFKELLSKSS